MVGDGGGDRGRDRNRDHVVDVESRRADADARRWSAAHTVAAPRTNAPSPTATSTLPTAKRSPVQDDFDGLVVHVVTADSAPAADIGVGVRGLFYEKTTTKWWECYRSIGRTDLTGTLRIERADLQATVDDAWWQQLREANASVHVDEPGLLDVMGAPLTRAELGRARCELQLPLTGRLRLISTDGLGEPLDALHDSLQVMRSRDRK